MFSKTKTSISGSQSFKSQSSLKKQTKKHAPPRPPQPSPSRLLTSQSFGTADELGSRSGFTISNQPNFNSNLIDFSSPVTAPTRPISQPINLIASTQADPPEFRYRVAASIFYIKSPLKNSTSGAAPEANPFSPPRPSTQSLTTTVIRSTTTNSAVKTSTKYISNPTIIKSQTTSDAQFNSSQTTQFNSGIASQQQTRYNNIPTQWDEPPRRIPITSAPTVIKPAPPPKKVGLGTKVLPPAGISRPNYAVVPEPRSYYDVPPDFDDDDDDDDDDWDSKPMPDMPPPPPPDDLEVQEWADSTSNAKTYYEPNGSGDRAYAIALYDYVPEAEGDLALQMGDLVYLLRKIDDSWLFGVCGGVEGMFPTNYVNVVVPLSDEENLPVPELSHVEQEYAYHYANVLYPFAAETESDLNLQIDEVVAILGRINDDWLYGEKGGSRGQFPATFVSPVPLDLPTITL